MKKLITLCILSACFLLKGAAQDDLLGSLMKDDSAKVKQDFTTATFKSTRIINFQSVEMTGKGNLQFMVSHHFPNFWNNGKGWQNIAQFFGFNSGVATTYLSFDYSVKDWMNFGLALTGNSRYETWAKFRLLRQQTGKQNIPVTVDYFALASIDASDGPSPDDLAWNRFNFLHQLLIARKFNDKFSLQLMPALIHYNYVPYGINNPNNMFSIGMGGRYKLTNKTAITFEYTRQLNGYKNLLDEGAAAVNYVPDLVSIGYDWDTGGHIFQFYFTSTTSSTNIAQLTTNTNDFKKGNFSLGFTINRSYGIRKVVQTH
jgi:hypothetical protein